MRVSLLGLCLALLASPLSASRAIATDVDGPDCGRVIHDFGDAPEGIDTGFLGRIGHFPTCIAPGAPGTQEFVCPPRSSPPGLTGYMHHVQDGTANYWLGCYQTLQGLAGIDSEADGKVSIGGGPSACNPSVTTDCTISSFGPIFGQDECAFDGDAGVVPDVFIACYPGAVRFRTANCGGDRTAYLNILVDMNFDGDWNDNMPCFDPLSIYCFLPCAPNEPCAHEWAVKNLPILVPAGCADQVSPTFRVSSRGGPAWMRVSLTDVPVDDDYPWAGSARRPGGVYVGGETEDYLTQIIEPDKAKSSTWGGVKLHYR
jgi:hypothetical protein